MLKFLPFMLLILQMSSFASAQSPPNDSACVLGSVFSATSKQPLPQAYVIAKNNATGALDSVLTDANGLFCLHLAAQTTYHLRTFHDRLTTPPVIINTIENESEPLTSLSTFGRANPAHYPIRPLP